MKKKKTIKFEFPRSSTIETVISVIVSKKFASNSSSINYSLYSRQLFQNGMILEDVNPFSIHRILATVNPFVSLM